MPSYAFVIGAKAAASACAAKGLNDGDLLVIVKASNHPPSDNPRADIMVFDHQHEEDADCVAAALQADPDALLHPSAEIAANIANSKGEPINASKRSLPYMTPHWQQLVEQVPNASPPRGQPPQDPRIGQSVSGHIPIGFANNLPIFANITNAIVISRSEDGSDVYQLQYAGGAPFFLDGASVDRYSAPQPLPRLVLSIPASSPEERQLLLQLALIKAAPHSKALAQPGDLDAEEAWLIIKALRPNSNAQSMPPPPILQALVVFNAPTLHSLAIHNLGADPSAADIALAVRSAMYTPAPGAGAPDAVGAAGSNLRPPPFAVDSAPPPPNLAPPPPPNGVRFGDPAWHNRYPLALQMAASAQSQQEWDAFLSASCKIVDPPRADTIATSEYMMLGALSRYLKQHITPVSLQQVIEEEKQDSVLLASPMLTNILLSISQSQPDKRTRCNRL
jgi:hypothetical protein